MIRAWVAIAALMICGFTHATASSELSHFFDNLGFANNVTGSHSYESQAAGFASLGSVYARSQVRTIQIAHVDVNQILAAFPHIIVADSRYHQNYRQNLVDIHPHILYPFFQ